LQVAGGENNAYTTNDLTNYYCQLPVENIETAFWLESDRMLSLAFSEKSLDVQRKVVSEEFKEHYLNKPYGDAWQIIREMAYTTILTLYYNRERASILRKPIDKSFSTLRPQMPSWWLPVM
jgi:predicted Zn-dependent peptidase